MSNKSHPQRTATTQPQSLPISSEGLEAFIKSVELNARAELANAEARAKTIEANKEIALDHLDKIDRQNIRNDVFRTKVLTSLVSLFSGIVVVTFGFVFWAVSQGYMSEIKELISNLAYGAGLIAIGGSFSRIRQFFFPRIKKQQQDKNIEEAEVIT